MGVIFWMSSHTAIESSKQSDGILLMLIKLFGDKADQFYNALKFIGDATFLIRKSAHLLEFTGLCFLFNIAWLQTKKKRMVIVSTICTSAYAITDELHQLFVEGRSCELRDWAIDTLGAFIGAIGFIAIYSIIKGIIKNKNNIDTGNI